MKKNLENIAQELIRNIRESVHLCHPDRIMPPVIQTEHFQQPLGLFAFGKSAVSMTEAFLKHSPIKPEFSLALTSPQYIPDTINEEITLLFGDHPYPGKSTIDSSRYALSKLTGNIPADGQIVMLISGGGSSLFEIPEPPYTIEQISSLTKGLMLKGADIYELNTVRKRLSSVKGGKLATLLHPRSILALIMSDVIGDNPEFIASGPVTPDKTYTESAIKILKKYDIDYTPLLKKTDITLHHDIKNVRSRIISNNNSLFNACEKLLKKSDSPVIRLPFKLEGEARQCGKRIADSIILTVKTMNEPFYVLTGGECSVTVTGKGKGGRNLELVLSAALELKNSPFQWITASVGSDGIDGPTDAAGGWLNSELLVSKDYSMAEKALLNNDTYPFFERLNTVIKTGYTGINLNDLFVAYIEP